MSAALIDSPTTRTRTTPKVSTSSGPIPPAGQPGLDTQSGDASGTPSPQGHGSTDAHAAPALGAPTPDRDQAAGDTHPSRVAVGPDSLTGHGRPDAHASGAGEGTNSGSGAKLDKAPNGTARRSLFDPTLYTLAAFLDDVEGLRKAQNNRLRILTATEPDEDGEMRGFGLDASHPVVATVEGLIGQLDAVEHQAILALNRTMRAHPLAAWQKQAKGVGEKQLARLLAAVGDPYLRADTGRPRTVSQLWAYCGLHTLPVTGLGPTDTHAGIAGHGASLPAGASQDASPLLGSPLPGNTAARRRKGVKANWSTDAKTRAYLIATSCIKQTGSEYRAVYDARRAHTALTHPDWTPGHSHNDGLRIVSKRILRDLWRAARDYHEGTES